MVFSGIPSKGCATCRTKKKKCDEAFPACSLCKRTGQICPGYRDQLSLNFRDESAGVERKIRQRARKKTCLAADRPTQPGDISISLAAGADSSPQHEPKRSGTVEASSTPDNASSISDPGLDSHSSGLSDFDQFLELDLDLDFPLDLGPLHVDEDSSPPEETVPGSNLVSVSPAWSDDSSISISISASLSLSLEAEARSFFFSNYVFAELDLPYSRLTCLPVMFGQIHETKALSDMIVSVGAAGMANLRKDDTLRHTADGIYTATIQRLQNQLCLRTPIQTDQTILLVLLLALYETITCHTARSLNIWSRHVRGAIALLSIFSQDSLGATAVQDLYLHLRSQTITECLMRKACIPRIIVDWPELARARVGEQQLGQNQLHDMSIQLCQLRCAIKDVDMPDEDVVSQAMALDSKLAAWAASSPTRCSYTQMYDFEHPESVFLGRYHLYRDTRVAIVWNHYRALRILTHELILDVLKPQGSIVVASLHAAQRLASEQVLMELTSDICSSIPPYLGHPNRQSTAPAMVGLSLLWPLYTCAAHRHVPPVTRNWVILQCERIGERMGIRLATLLAKALRAMGGKTDSSRIDDAYRHKSVIEEIEESV